MISAETIAELEARELLYIRGAPAAATSWVLRELVLDDPLAVRPVLPPSAKKRWTTMAKVGPLPGRRYIVCRNPTDCARRTADPRQDPGALERE